MSTPQSQIYICSGVNLDNRYEHTLYFSDIDEQIEYFAGKVVKTFSAYSFLRKSWDIRVQGTLKEAESWSYLYFYNGSPTTNKPYFYFINSAEYVNDYTVVLHIEMDIMQTFLFDYELNTCFVERQHTTTDEIGQWTAEENLECGTLIDCGMKDLLVGSGTLCILVLATINPNEAATTTPAPALSSMYNGVFSGLKLWAVPSSKWAEWGAQLEALTEAGFIEGIVNMWMYPQSLVKLGGEATWTDSDLAKPVDSSWAEGTDFSGENEYTPFGGYTPRNNKLYCYPYNFLYMSNNAGGSATYAYERFTGANGVHFRAYGTVSPEAAFKIVPCHYNGVEENYEMGLSLGNYPTCAWDSDVYKLWLAQNYNQQNVQGASTILQAGAGIASGIGGLITGNIMAGVSGVGLVANAATSIAQQVAQHKDMQVQPPQAHGSYSSGVNMTAGKHCFTIYNKSVDYTHARMIDYYFQMYGYKIGRIQVPNRCTRKVFTYVKTIGCLIESNLSNEYATKICNIFDKGITFWRVPWRIGNFTVDNSPL